MTAEIQVGTSDGIPTCYSLLFSNGLRLKTDSLPWLGKHGRDAVREQFLALVDSLRESGIEVTGELK